MCETALCAWCLQEQGIAPDENDSHGICQVHSDLILAQAQAHRAERVAREQRSERNEKEPAHVHHHR